MLAMIGKQRQMMFQRSRSDHQVEIR